DLDDRPWAPGDLDDVDVGGLEVAMDDPLLVGGGHAGADLVHEAEHEFGVEALARLDEVFEGLALEQLHHHEVERAGLGAAIDDVDDVGVLQLAEQPRLAEEAIDAAGRDAGGDVNGLDGDRPAQGDLRGAVDDPHAALADLALDAVGPFEGPAD